MATSSAVEPSNMSFYLSRFRVRWMVSDKNFQGAVAGVPDLGSIGRMAGDDTAVGCRVVRRGVVAVNAESGAAEHSIGWIGIENNGCQAGMGRIDKSRHRIAALRQWAHIVLVLHRRVIQAWAVS